jgi:hypothetical protein
MRFLILFLLTGLLLTACKKDPEPGPPILSYFYINDEADLDKLAVDKDAILNIKFSFTIDPRKIVDNKIRSCLFYYEIDGAPGDTLVDKGKINADDFVAQRFMLLNDLVKQGAAYACSGGEKIGFYLFCDDFDGGIRSAYRELVVGD